MLGLYRIHVHEVQTCQWESEICESRTTALYKKHPCLTKHHDEVPLPRQRLLVNIIKKKPLQQTKSHLSACVQRLVVNLQNEKETWVFTLYISVNWDRIELYQCDVFQTCRYRDAQTYVG